MNVCLELTTSLVRMKLSSLNNYLELSFWLLEHASILVMKGRMSLVSFYPFNCFDFDVAFI
jgi:hypothetical protein